MPRRAFHYINGWIACSRCGFIFAPNGVTGPGLPESHERFIKIHTCTRPAHTEAVTP